MSEAVKLSKEVKISLRGVVALMEKNLTRIDMGDWVSVLLRKDKVPAEYCGTTGCIAGYICLAAGYSEKFLRKLNYTFNLSEIKLPKKARKPTAEISASPYDNFDAGSIARALMGLGTEVSLDFLFFYYHWPEPYKKDYSALLNDEGYGNLPLSNRKKAGRIVIKRLKHFIKTGL